MLPAIFSLQGLMPTPEEAKLFASANPVGFIIFKRNIDTPDQVRALVSNLKNLVGRDCPILIDQEGGRVARLNAPHWPMFKPFQYFGDLYAEHPDRARIELAAQTWEIAGILNHLGINTNCSPVLDVRMPGAHDIIGDRAFSVHPDVVADLGDVVCRTFLDRGITPILKHAPGHGRALSDSHLELPAVNEPLRTLDQIDFAPFRAIAEEPYADRTWMMTAHILYPQIDPDLPATLSSKVMNEIVRDRIGYPGVIIGDDMDMKALAAYGDIVERSVNTLAAGCDLVLNCHGHFEDMAALAGGLPKLGESSVKRLAVAAPTRYAA